MESQLEETRTAIVRVDEEGILRLRIKEGIEVKEEDVKDMFETYRKLGCDKKKVFQLIEDTNFYMFDKEAQKYASKVGKDFFIASALVNKSLGVSLLFNFFNSFLKPGVPFRMFVTEEKALEWLRSFKKNECL